MDFIVASDKGYTFVFSSCYVTLGKSV